MFDTSAKVGLNKESVNNDHQIKGKQKQQAVIDTGIQEQQNFLFGNALGALQIFFSEIILKYLFDLGC